MTDAQKEILVELSECSDQINDSNYTDAQRATLRELEKLHLVDLRWVLTVKGEALVKANPGR